jgi:hypothetical protein
MVFAVGIPIIMPKEKEFTSLGRLKIIKAFLDIKTQKQKKLSQIGIKRAGSIENLMCLEKNPFGTVLAQKQIE